MRFGERFEIAEREAAQLRLPLVEPDGYPLRDCRPVARAAVFAADHGAARRFALAASRLAFCGGFDLTNPEVIAEAARAADISSRGALRATRDERYDVPLDSTCRGIVARGVCAGPAIRIGSRWFQGLDAVPGASMFAATQALYGGPQLTGV